MTVAKTLALGLTVLFISSNILADEMSNQMKLKEVEATCDTDYNCEVLWEKYKTYNIKSIFTAPDNRQRNTKHDPNVLEITCNDSKIKRYIATEAELSTVCTSNSKLLTDIEEFAKESGETDKFTLNWEQLEFMVEANMTNMSRTPINNPHKNAPTVEDLISFMKKHPEVIVGGIYKNEAKAKEICNKANKPNDQCFKENYGIHVSNIMVRFGDSDEIPRWFSDFCSLSNLDIIEHTRGFWECTW